jgi:hypothetical protein
VRGFVNQVIERIPVEDLRAQFESLVRARVVGPTDSEDDA